MLDPRELALRQEIIDTCRTLDARGINQGTSGNVSARWNAGMLITPSALPYDEMRPQDLAFLPLEGDEPSQGPRPPSSEWRFHRDILASRGEVGAVVHTHSTYATALAILGENIPAHHYMVAVSGGNSIRCAPYATYGTAELSQNALQALEGRTCCLLANHGVIATGPNLKKALWLAGEIETLAKQCVIARQLGEPYILSEEEMGRVLEKFTGYGLKDD
jgi:L-fuculose-phosphate aldolase